MLRYAVECSFLFVGALLRGRAVEFRIFFPLGAAHRRVGERDPVELRFFCSSGVFEKDREPRRLDTRSGRVSRRPSPKGRRQTQMDP